MRAAQLVIVETDGWIARLAADLAAESAWLVRTPRGPGEALDAVRTRRPSVLLVQIDPNGDPAPALALISDAARLFPDVPVVAVSDAKFNDADRTAWTAALFDLGARYALFPPLTKPVLEDVVSGLMGAAARRCGALDPAPLTPPYDPQVAKTLSSPPPYGPQVARTRPGADGGSPPPYGPQVARTRPGADGGGATPTPKPRIRKKRADEEDEVIDLADEDVDE